MSQLKSKILEDLRLLPANPGFSALMDYLRGQRDDAKLRTEHTALSALYNPDMRLQGIAIDSEYRVYRELVDLLDTLTDRRG